MATPSLKVSKTDAAKRQIETAIRLWLVSGEPVSIHTLAAAALQVLHDVGRKKGVATMIYGCEVVRPERRTEFRRLISTYENFFKHADRDPNAVLDFNPDLAELFIFDAVVTYEALTREMVPLLSTFKAWMFFQRPDYMREVNRTKFIETLKQNQLDVSHFGKMSKAEFFADYQTALLNLGFGKK